VLLGLIFIRAKKFKYKTHDNRSNFIKKIYNVFYKDIKKIYHKNLAYFDVRHNFTTEYDTMNPITIDRYNKE
jgi:hypothetical protein